MVTNEDYAAMEEIKNQRRKQAEDKGIYHKAVEIVKRLGAQEGKRHGSNHNYSDDEVSIWWDDYGSNMDISLVSLLDEQAASPSVFKVQLGKVMGYRPDVSGWENHLLKLYTGLNPDMKAEEAVERAKRRSEFFKEWGQWPNP